jgi:3-hydroxyisobutyrate dehydrogenase
VKNVATIDAPVSGGDVGARNGKLAIMCGGETEAFAKIEAIMTAYGANIKLMGGPGMGQHTKMANQIVICGNMIGMVEGLLYGKKAGLDLNEMIPLLGSGAASSASLTVLGPRVVARNFDPGFYIEHFVKDMGIALDEAKAMNLCLPGLAMVSQLYQSLMANEEGRLGTQALALVLERMNNAQIN